MLAQQAAALAGAQLVGGRDQIGQTLSSRRTPSRHARQRRHPETFDLRRFDGFDGSTAPAAPSWPVRCRRAGFPSG